ncbi:hypothetical protein ARC310_08175 [Pantoea ananatis]|nr:hypothetical protein ARC310_08175 [Pantoea ananatis]PZD69279.1 hypothetical protein ARC311_04395 [Pantoea ananatis]
MGHLSPYSKAELRLQSGCGKAMDGYITAKCGDIQPDMEMHMCSECNKRWTEAVKKMHEKE